VIQKILQKLSSLKTSRTDLAGNGVLHHSNKCL